MARKVHVTIGSLRSAHPDDRSHVQLVKSALLYADQVTLLSPATYLYRRLTDLQQAPMDEAARVFTAIAPNGGQDLADQLVDLLALRNKRIKTDSELAGLELYESGMREVWEGQMLPALEEMYMRSGLPDLQPALESGLLQLETVSQNDDLDDLRLILSSDLPQFADEITARLAQVLFERLTTTSTYPLFDRDVALLMTPIFERFGDRFSDASRRHVTNTPTADALINTLPSFELATVEEILDIRKDLQDALVNFRSAVATFTEEIKSLPMTDDFDREVDHLYDKKVAPALKEIRDAIQTNSLRYRFTDRAVHDRWLQGSGISFGVTQLYDLPTLLGDISIETMIEQLGLASGLATGGVVIHRVIEELWERRKEARRIRNHQFYFLYQTEEILRKRQS